MAPRRRSRAAAAAEPVYVLDAATTNDQIEIKYHDNVWYGATVIGKRKKAEQPTELNFRYFGHSKKSTGAWISVAESTVRFITTDENQMERHIEHFDVTTGCVCV